MTGWRPATAADAGELTRVEREANLVGLAHVFPIQEFPFPDAEVEARWAATLADPAVTTEIAEQDRAVAFAAWDDTGRLRHLAVVPEQWGSGLAREGVDRAVRAIRAAGATPTLWVLLANHRARGLYAHLGWTSTGAEKASEWSPYPREMELVLTDS